MSDGLIESKAGMSFHLDGENQIDALLLSKMISDMVELTKLTAKEANPDAYLKMNITAFKNGSFQIDFSAVCQVVENLFSNANDCAGLAATVIGGVKGIFEIKKMLKGKKAKSVSDAKDGKITVESQDGEKVTVPEQSQVVMNMIHVDQLVVNISSYVNEHNPSGGFSISSDGKSFYCGKDEMHNMTKPLPITEISTCQRSRVEAQLIIRKAVFEGRSKWGFSYNGRAIEAAIEDDEFMHNFQYNGAVNKGDYINATLEIYVDLDMQGIPIKGTEKYTVTKIHGGIQHCS